MTNLEWLMKEKTELVKDCLATRNKLKAYGNGNVVLCSPDTFCEGCIFNGYSTSCSEAVTKWLDEEHNPYTIPIDTPIDTKVLISDDGMSWNRRYFAGFSNDTNQPYLVFQGGATSWSSGGAFSSAWKYCKLAEEDNK